MYYKQNRALQRHPSEIILIEFLFVPIVLLVSQMN